MELCSISPNVGTEKQYKFFFFFLFQLKSNLKLNSSQEDVGYLVFIANLLTSQNHLFTFGPSGKGLSTERPLLLLFCDTGLTYLLSMQQEKLQLHVFSAADQFSLSENGLLSFASSRQLHPTPVFLPGKSHGRRSLVGCSPWGRRESDTTEQLHFHFSLPWLGEGSGNPLQCSCLENPRDGGAWCAAVYGVSESRTRLK